jgi:uncharacterized membrane protein
MLKAVPLLTPLFGLLRGRLYTFRWTPFLSLPYLCEGLVRAWTEHGAGRSLALAEIVLSLGLLAGTITYVRLSLSTRESR